MTPPRPPATRFALLGVLALAPMSGYAIRKFAADHLRHFWSESYGQIYPTLRALEAEGFVQAQAARGAARADRRVYAITPRGREALKRWIVAAPKARPPRNELLLKLFFGAPEVDADLAVHLERLRRTEQAELALYRRLERELPETQRGHRALPYWLMTLSFGRHRSESLVRWADEALATLRARPARRPAPRRASPRRAR